MQEFKTMLTFSFKTLTESLPNIIGVIITSITLYVYVGMLTVVQFRMGVGARQLQVSDDKCLQYKIGLLLIKPLLKESLIVKLEKKIYV